jgi:hypothetical protein
VIATQEKQKMTKREKSKTVKKEQEREREGERGREEKEESSLSEKKRKLTKDDEARKEKKTKCENFFFSFFLSAYFLVLKVKGKSKQLPDIHIPRKSLLHFALFLL